MSSSERSGGIDGDNSSNNGGSNNNNSNNNEETEHVSDSHEHGDAARQVGAEDSVSDVVDSDVASFGEIDDLPHDLQSHDEERRTSNNSTNNNNNNNGSGSDDNSSDNEVRRTSSDKDETSAVTDDAVESDGDIPSGDHCQRQSGSGSDSGRPIQRSNSRRSVRIKETATTLGHSASDHEASGPTQRLTGHSAGGSEHLNRRRRFRFHDHHSIGHRSISHRSVRQDVDIEKNEKDEKTSRYSMSTASGRRPRTKILEDDGNIAVTQIGDIGAGGNTAQGNDGRRPSSDQDDLRSVASQSLISPDSWMRDDGNGNSNSKQGGGNSKNGNSSSTASSNNGSSNAATASTEGLASQQAHETSGKGEAQNDDSVAGSINNLSSSFHAYGRSDAIAQKRGADDAAVGPQIYDDELEGGRQQTSRLPRLRSHDDDWSTGSSSVGQRSSAMAASGGALVPGELLLAQQQGGEHVAIRQAAGAQEYDPSAHNGLYTAQGELVDDLSTSGTEDESQTHEGDSTPSNEIDGGILSARSARVSGQPTVGQERSREGPRTPRGNRIINVVDPSLGEPVLAEEMEREIVDADGNIIRYDDAEAGQPREMENSLTDDLANGDTDKNRDPSGDRKCSSGLTALCACIVLSIIVGIVMLTSACSLFPEMNQCEDDDSSDAGGRGAGPTPTQSPASPATTFLTSLTCEGSVAVGVDGEAVDLVREKSPTATSSQTSGGASRNMTQTTIGCGEQESWTGYHSWIAIDGLETYANGGGEAINIKMASDSSLATWMVAFDGASCDDLGCAIAFGNCTTRQCALVIPAAKRESVTVAIGGMEPFDYTIRSQLIASNDRCEIARPLDVILTTTSESETSMPSIKPAVVVTGSYEYATPADTSLASCGVKSGVATWYSVKTNVSGIVTASTCIDNGSGNDSGSGSSTSSSNANPSSVQGNAPAYITVFRGDCGSLQCATETNSVSCGSRNQVTWYSEDDEEYFLAISAPPADHPDWNPADGLSTSSTSTNGSAETGSKRNGLRSSSSASAPAAISTSASTIDPENVDYQLSIRQTADNDICHKAQSIDGLSSFSFRKLYASHRNAASDDTPSCELSSVQDVVARKGTWYAVNGTGSLMKVSTCLDDNFGDGGMNSGDDEIPFQSVKAQVFKGSCDNLRCLDGVETVFNRGCKSPHETDAEFDSDSNFNEVAWQSNLDETYFVHVSSKEILSKGGTNGIAPNNPSADTSTNIDTTTDAGPSSSPEFAFSIQSAVRNDLCEAAVPLDVGGNISIHASTMEATIPTEFTSGCGLASGVVSPGVWYTVVGDDSYIDVDTCKSLDMTPHEYDASLRLDLPAPPPLPNETTFRLFDNQITILRGNDCNSLECVTGNNRASDRCVFQSETGWFAQRNRRYFILIHSALGGQGEFILSTTKSDKGAYDKRCHDAESIKIGESITQDTSYAAQAFGSYCGGFETTGAATWLKVVGNGKRLIASTCSTFTRYRSRILVLEGDVCGSLNCRLNQNFGSCPFQGLYGSTFEQGYVEFDSKADVTYHLIVHGTAGEEGSFILTVDEAVPNDQCDGAIGLKLGDEPIQISSSVLKTSVTEGCSGAFYRRRLPTIDALWYEVMNLAERTQLTISICHLGSFRDLELRAYAGSCGDLHCAASEYFPQQHHGACGDDTLPSPTLTWISEPHQAYRIAVMALRELGGGITPGLSKGSPTFNISVSSHTLDNNTVCDEAEFIGVGESINGSFKRAALDEDVMDCYVQEDFSFQRRNVDLVGSWYYTIGTGRQMIASSCLDQIHTRPTIVIVTGGKCGNLTCIDSSTHFCGVNGQVSWESETGTMYRVWIGTEGFFTSNYSLHVADSSSTSSTPPPLSPLAVPSATSTSNPWKAWIDVDFPAYDECEHAVTLEVSTDTSDITTDVLLSMTLVTNDYHVDMCGSAYPQLVGGAWFHVHGMGKLVKMTVNTIKPSDDYQAFGEEFTRDARFVVYQAQQEPAGASSDCESLRCVHGNSQGGDWSQHTFATWFAEDGVDYYIQVYNVYPSIAARLTLIEHTQAGAACGYNVVDGMPTNVIEKGDTVLSVTRRGSPQSEVVPTICDGQDGIPHNNGAWFSFIGDGKRVRASTSNPGSNANMTIQVYSYDGDSCDMLECVAATYHEDIIGFKFNGIGYTVMGHQDVDWTTAQGQRYSLFVQATGDGADGDDAIQHVFELSTTELRSVDTCDGARPARVGRLIKFIFESELGPDTTGSQCDDPLADWWNFPGAWYTVVGDGTTMVASTCAERPSPSGLSTQVSVYSGTCGALSCVGSSDVYCDRNGQVAWSSEAGTTYYVLIRHPKWFARQTDGTYLRSAPQASSTCSGIATAPLELRDEMTFVVPASNPTFTSMPVEPNVSDEQEEQMASVVPSCDFKFKTSSSNVAWLSVIGSGGYMMVSTRGFDTRFNSTVEVYSGRDCNQLSCVDGAVQSRARGWLSKDGDMTFHHVIANGPPIHQGSLSWQSAFGEEYFIRISGVGTNESAGSTAASTATGTAEKDAGDSAMDNTALAGSLVSVKVEANVANDHCENAIPLYDRDEVFVDMSTATIDDIDLCHSPRYPNVNSTLLTHAAVWYKILASELQRMDSGMRITACSPIPGTQIGVFVGDDCDSLRCLQTVAAFGVTNCVEHELPADSDEDVYLLLMGGTSSAQINVRVRQLYLWDV